MDDMYRENILEHYRHPLNYGQLEHPTFEAEGVNPLCGDELHVQVGVGEDGTVNEVRFSGHGCAISQASMSMLSEHIIGKSLDEVASLTREDITDMLGIPLSPVRLKWEVAKRMYGADPVARATIERKLADVSH